MISLKKRFYKIVYPSDSRKDPNFTFDVVIITLILLNVLAVIIESVPEINARFQRGFERFEIFSVVVFTLEYLIRLWTCTEMEAYKKPVTGRLKWSLTPMALIDLLAVLPFYLPFIGVDLRFIRIFRLFRIFRLLKIARYTSALYLIRKILVNKKEELFVTLLFSVSLLIVFSTLMFYAERQAQPEVFTSIPKSMWWAVITLTSVGYGDIYPITTLGRILGGLIAISGIGLFALPTGILASGFSDEIAKRKNPGK
ncbi:ion transporter [Fulvivirgaceae bacterium BMA12]|uniref:Ion transporter n=1 Tax=Agaribacillus aureus TaxID=3051825 RepID=A0ABT8L6K4_9BACT|nr:ion transporter [Fulvivirgaceae bacterium BMA12]